MTSGCRPCGCGQENFATGKTVFHCLLAHTFHFHDETCSVLRWPMRVVPADDK